jgi:transcriptional regulator with XRE-family HTH domain
MPEHSPTVTTNTPQTAPQPAVQAPRPDETPWRKWMANLGDRARQMREVLGLSQEQLARRAGVSQGAISRYEAGRGLNTPLLVSMRIHAALGRGLRTMDPQTLTDEVQRFLQQLELFGVPQEEGKAPHVSPLPVLIDPELEAVIRRYRTLPEPKQRALVTAFKAITAAIAAD